MGHKRGSLVIGEVKRHNGVNMGSESRPVIPEIDIWRAANLLIRKDGPGAASEAMQLAGRMLDRGDSEGWQVWARIRLAVEALQAPRRGEQASYSRTTICSLSGTPDQNIHA